MRSLRRAIGWLKSRFSSPALILMYHRISDLPGDPYLLSVTRKHFAEQMAVVRRRCVPIGLPRLPEQLRDGPALKRAIVVTFDDGYADNLYNAKPILERYEIPASVFVTTGYIGSIQEFWWDELDRLLLQPGTLPSRLELSHAGRTSLWELGDCATYTADDFERYREWHVERQDSPTARHRLHRSLYHLLHNLAPQDQQQLLGTLRTWASAEPNGRPAHRTLTPDEVIQLAQDGLVEIGAHAVTHAPLATLAGTTQRDEIRCSRSHLEELTDRPVTSFAYPHGSYSPETLAIVQDEGFALACSSDTSVISRASDRFRLPRMSMRNWDGDTFSAWLTTWLGG